MFFKPIKNALTHQIFENNSSFQLQSTQKSKSGKDVDTGRGLSANLLWVDEAGSVDLEKLSASIFPTTSTVFTFCKQNNVPHIILLSGTANGRVGIGKKFYDLWCKVEPPKNKENKYMGGYKLFWKDIPGKDEVWYQQQAEKSTPREMHQEFDCVFYGTENSLFTDDQIVKIQERSNSIKLVEPNYIYTTPQGYLSKGTFYDSIKRNHNYIIGVDTATGRGNDNTAIEVLDFDSLEQIFELKDNNIQNDDLVKTINNIVLNFINSKCNIVLTIESNMTGSAVISDLKSLNPIYKNLIYRNTISSDISIKNNSELIDYFKCEHGININNSTRELLINYLFKYIANNLNSIHSKELIQEIESLEIDSKGKVVGYPHDDMVFALGHCLLIKNRARKQNLYSIFRYCEDIRNDETISKTITLSLENYDEDLIKEVIDENINGNDLVIGQSGITEELSRISRYNENNNNDYYSLDSQLNMMPFSNLNPSMITHDMIKDIRSQVMRSNMMMVDNIKKKKQQDLLSKESPDKKKIINKLKNKVKKKTRKERLDEESLTTASSFSDNNYYDITQDSDYWFGVAFQ